MKQVNILLIIILFILPQFSLAQGLIINEFMSDNSIIPDEDEDYSDWIELYNDSNTPINLLNYSLSDDSDDLRKWIFPTVIIPPFNYLLIFASDKNRMNPNQLHTNFKISANGEAIYLLNETESIIDQTAVIALANNQTYGRLPDGSQNWTILNTASPTISNNFSNQLSFSHQAGFHNLAFDLIVNSTLQDTIYYTSNGDIPTVYDNIYTTKIVVENKNQTPNVFSEIVATNPTWEMPDIVVDKATILRFATYRNGIRTSPIYTKTFFVEDGIFEKYTIPVISLVSAPDNFFGQDSGIYVPGVHLNINNPSWTGNYYEKGGKWERDVHISFFENDGTLGFEQDAGVRIHGGATRRLRQKSLRLYARKEYGKKTFDYQLMPQKAVDNYKRFILRTSMTSWHGEVIIHDLFAQSIASQLNVDYQDFQPVIVYLNGEYWGIHNIRDRLDEHYIAYTHGIDEAEVEIKAWVNPDYDNLMQYIRNNDLSNQNYYEYVKAKIDIENFIDYNIAEQFFGNYDWPGNNSKLWRHLPDGKWRWMLYDLDGGFRYADYNMLIHSTLNDTDVTWPNPPYSTFLLRNLLKNEAFKNQFINRYTEALNTIFDFDAMTEQLYAIKALYQPEIEKHAQRWEYPLDETQWEMDIDQHIIDFIQKRPCIIKNNMINFFELDTFYYECRSIKAPLPNSALLFFPNPSDGICFISNGKQNIDDAELTIYNIGGQIIFKEKGVSIRPQETKTLNLSHLSNGTYILSIRNQTLSQQQKIILIR